MPWATAAPPDNIFSSRSRPIHPSTSCKPTAQNEHWKNSTFETGADYLKQSDISRLWPSRAIMRRISNSATTKCAAMILGALALIFTAFQGNLHAHPLGNFTINHFTRLEVGRER